MRIFSILSFMAVLLAFSGCNTTPRIEVPEAAVAAPIEVVTPIGDQASFALSKVIANIRRGQKILQFPGSGFSEKGIKGSRCNHLETNQQAVEWGAGSKALGNWRDAFGEAFYETLSARNLNVAGNPKDLFGQKDAVLAAEYWVGAIITDIRGNACHEHNWPSQFGTFRYSGEMYVNVEWTVYSNQQKRQVLKASTQGYYRQIEPKSAGLTLMLHGAFARAAENLAADKQFIDVAARRNTVANQSNVIGPQRAFRSPKIRTTDIKGHIQSLLPAVVTIRLGTAHGSGFSISRDGMVLTNAHVVGMAKQVTVILSNGLEVNGTVERVDKRRDAALVKIPLRIPSALPIREAPAKTLERVYAIGSPMHESLKSTVTSGIVSGMRRMKPDNQLLIQADVPVSPGNSGGPLLDRHGNVMGISTVTFSGRQGQNLNGFIPIGEALKSLRLKIAPGSRTAAN